jgi:hypothetical protein
MMKEGLMLAMLMLMPLLLGYYYCDHRPYLSCDNLFFAPSLYRRQLYVHACTPPPPLPRHLLDDDFGG